MLEFKYRMAKMSKNTHFDRPFNLLNSVKSKCKIIKTWRLHHQLALEQYFILLMDFWSIIELEVAEFVVQNCPIYKKKSTFFASASIVIKKNWGFISIKKFFTICQSSKNSSVWSPISCRLVHPKPRNIEISEKCHNCH